MPGNKEEVIKTAESRLKRLALDAYDNPINLYVAAGSRLTMLSEDRIYGIMQIFGFCLGSSREPGRTFSLPELEIQFAEEVNARSPPWAQMFVHTQKPSAGRHWCISQFSKLPDDLHFSNHIPRSRCTIRLDSRRNPTFIGLAAPFPQFARAVQSASLQPEKYGFWGSRKLVNGFREVEFYALDICDFTEDHVEEGLRYIEPENYEGKQRLRQLLDQILGDELHVCLIEKLYSSTVVEEYDEGDVDVNIDASMGLLTRRVRRDGRDVWQRIGITIWDNFRDVNVPSITWQQTEKHID